MWTLLCGLPGLDLFSDVVINITVHVDGLGLSPGAGFRRVFAIDRPLLCWFFFFFWEILFGCVYHEDCGIHRNPLN